MDRVCSSCFEDDDVRAWIRGHGGPRGCDACGGHDSPTHELPAICAYLEDCLGKFWGLAVEQLPYETAEGGYLGQTWDSAEVLFDEEGLSLPRDHDGSLREAILSLLTDEIWCEFDWLTLDDDVALQGSWERFCETIKHQRRFFFHALGGDDEDRDAYSAQSLLKAIATMCDQLGFVKVFEKGTRLWRARSDIRKGKHTSMSDFGAPPRALALQSNRMNPPGIPMMYGASTAITATVETRTKSARAGLWKTLRDIRVLDLRKLPPVPGTFSDADRRTTLGLRFLRLFARAIMAPVARDQRVHVDYLPSQVVTEYLKDYEFEGGGIDGIAYGSTVHKRGWNIALFTDISSLCAKGASSPEAWLEFINARRVTV